MTPQRLEAWVERIRDTCWADSCGVGLDSKEATIVVNEAYEAGRKSRQIDAVAYTLLRTYAHLAFEGGKTSREEYDQCLGELEKAYR